MSLTEKAIVEQQVVLSDVKSRDGDDDVAKRMLSVLSKIEDLGGSSAFEAWLEETGNNKWLTSPNYVDHIHGPYHQLSLAPPEEHQVPVLVSITSWVAYTHISVAMSGTSISGSGGAMGISYGGTTSMATLRYPGDLTLELFKYRVTTFRTVPEPGPWGKLTLLFYAGEELLGGVSGICGGIGFMIPGLVGRFKFK
ncbi:hypothetical protein EW026_g8019 [Hermanssonia centrifuga]|uniref:Uncharacterized protein n=1 Tax=Hermanssonia centrifuga TaxID=98765 RepID=A0A4S4K7M7_9APHY|nr:hypothetical protein EW026_g8019 [Hermanssonia centrifuga]